MAEEPPDQHGLSSWPDTASARMRALVLCSVPASREGPEGRLRVHVRTRRVREYDEATKFSASHSNVAHTNRVAHH